MIDKAAVSNLSGLNNGLGNRSL